MILHFMGCLGENPVVPKKREQQIKDYTAQAGYIPI
jgi:hypothetical protein